MWKASRAGKWSRILGEIDVAYLKCSLLKLNDGRVVEADALGIYQYGRLLVVLRVLLDPDEAKWMKKLIETEGNSETNIRNPSIKKHKIVRK